MQTAVQAGRAWSARAALLAIALVAAIDAAVAAAGPTRLAPQPQAAGGPVVDHRSVGDFLALTPEQLAAAAALRMLFVDHSVGANISDGLDCTHSATLEGAPNRCTRFEHVTPELSANPAHFRFGSQYDRSRWLYQAGGGSYWREWPAYIEELLRADDDWDVVIPMPSYLVAPNGGWQAIEELEAAHPAITFVYATSSLPRGADGAAASDQTMERFNAEARAYALEHGKPLLDVADLLSHDYMGAACYDTRDGVEYCQTPERCENLPDDGLAIPAICQHYTTELFGGHLGSVSGGALRMSQAVWVLMAELAESRRGQGPSPTASGTEPPSTSAVGPSPTASGTEPPSTSAVGPSPTASGTEPPPSGTERPAGGDRCYIPFAAA